MKKQHLYTSQLEWTGNLGNGTNDYKSYSRNHSLSVVGKPIILGSSDPNFRGDATRYNPEELMMSSLSACHMLWYLHLCAVNEVVVLEYSDQATGIMVEHVDGSGEFTEATLKPMVKVKEAAMKSRAFELHDEAAKMCFIARSVNFKIRHEPVITS